MNFMRWSYLYLIPFRFTFFHRSREQNCYQAMSYWLFFFFFQSLKRNYNGEYQNVNPNNKACLADIQYLDEVYAWNFFLFINLKEFFLIILQFSVCIKNQQIPYFRTWLWFGCVKIKKNKLKALSWRTSTT